MLYLWNLFNKFFFSWNKIKYDLLIESDRFIYGFTHKLSVWNIHICETECFAGKIYVDILQMNMKIEGMEWWRIGIGIFALLEGFRMRLRNKNV